MKKSEIIDRLRQSRRALLAAVQDIPEEALVRARQVDGGSVKDLLAHLAAWDEEGIRVLQAFALPGEARFSYTIAQENDFGAWNAEQTVRHKGLSLADVRREMDMARRDLIQVVDSLTEPVLNRAKRTPWQTNQSAYGVLEDLVAHELEHTADLQSWRKKMDRWKRARARLSAKRKTKPSAE